MSITSSKLNLKLCISIRFARLAFLLSLSFSTTTALEHVAGQFNTVINVPGDEIPEQVGPNAQLNIFAGSEIKSTFKPIPNSEVNIYGGIVRSSINVNSGSVVNMLDGTIDRIWGVDSQVEIRGGTVKRDLSVSNSELSIFGGYVGKFHSGIDSRINIFGGTVGSLSTASSGSVVNVFDGSLGGLFDAYSGSEVNIYGGTVGGLFEAYQGSTVNMFGGFTGWFFEIHSGSTLNVSGGIMDDVRASGGIVNISGGEVGGLRSEGNTVVNLSGGSIEQDLDLYAGSVAKISGGSAGDHMTAFSGSRVELTGGSIGGYFSFSPGSKVHISGGTLGRAFNWFDSRGSAEIIGGEFRVNGESFENSQIELAETDVFTGRLKDGSVFLFSPIDRDSLNSVQLISGELPAVDLDPILLNDNNGPSGLTYGQCLTLVGGGSLNKDFAAVGAKLDILGGTVGDGLEIYGSQVRFTGGQIGSGVVAHSTSSLQIAGGHFSRGLAIQPHATAVVSGGTFGHGFTTKPGSAVSLVGGEFLLNGVKPSGPTVTLSQLDILTGTLHDGTVFAFTSLAGDQIQGISLVEAELPLAEETFLITSDNHTLTGLRAGQSVKLVDGGVLPDNFTAINATLTIEGGAVGRQLELVSSKLDLSGGVIGPAVHAYANSVVNISGGTIGTHLKAFSSSIVNLKNGILENLFAFESSNINLSGGQVGHFTIMPGSKISVIGGRIVSFYENYPGSDIHISGGEFQSSQLRSSGVRISGGTFTEFPLIGGEVLISGGSFPDGLGVVGAARIAGGVVGDELIRNTRSGGPPPEIYLTAWGNGEVILSGGSINSKVRLDHTATLHIVGSNFILDGVDITAKLIPKIPFAIQDRNVVLETILADGSPFSISLNSIRVNYEDYLSPESTLMITLIPEPHSLILLLTTMLGISFLLRSVDY